MRGKLIVLLIAAVLLESTIFSFPITLIVLSVYLRSGGSGAIKWAFMAGILLDYLEFRALGLSSLFFLTMSLLISRYQKKLHFGNFIYFLIFLAVVYTIYGFLFLRFVTGANTVASIVIGALFAGIVNWTTRFNQENEGRIKV